MNELRAGKSYRFRVRTLSDLTADIWIEKHARDLVTSNVRGIIEVPDLAGQPGGGRGLWLLVFGFCC
jgi:hypothetical protein